VFTDNPQNEHKDYTLSLNHRMKNSVGKWIDLYQKCTYITSPKTNKPLYCMGIGFDITPFKKDNSIVHTVEKNEDGHANTIIDTQYFYPNQEDSLLTKREKEIIKWVCTGAENKEIAQKLHLSVHTVKQHRKNIFQKTNKKNVAELIAFAINNGII
jgi:DNA-binding CsgD family transcriptional regulator